MNKADDTRKQGLKILLMLGVTGLVVFFGYGPLFELVGGGVPGRVLGATFGSIFAILMTMFLLNKQTEIEQESKKSERVFDEKIQLYKNVLDRTQQLLDDGQLDSKEMLALPFTLVQMQMVGGDNAISAFTNVYGKVTKIYGADDNDTVKIPDDESDELMALMSEFAIQCRVDLGISDKPPGKEVFERARNALEQSSEAVKGKRDTSKYTFQGTAYSKGRLVQAVVSDYVVSNPQVTFDELKEIFPDQWQAGSSKAANRAVFVRLSDAVKLFEDKGYRRHFFKDGEPIQLADEVIAVSNQWGIDNIGGFVEGCNSIHDSKIS